MIISGVFILLTKACGLSSSTLRLDDFVNGQLGLGQWPLVLFSLGTFLLKSLPKLRTRLHVESGWCGLFIADTSFFVTEEYLDVSLVFTNQNHIVKSYFLFLPFLEST